MGFGWRLRRSFGWGDTFIVGMCIGFGGWRRRCSVGWLGLMRGFFRMRWRRLGGLKNRGLAVKALNMGSKNFWKLNIFVWGEGLGGVLRRGRLCTSFAGAHIPVLGLCSIPGTDVPQRKYTTFLFSILIVLYFFFSFSLQAAVAGGADVYSFHSPQENERFLGLTKELRCLVCQNQSLADSDADLAKDLRAKIYLMIEEKKSDEEIRAFLVARYGRFILFSPPLERATLFLWGFPSLLLISVFSVLFWVQRKSSH